MRIAALYIFALFLVSTGCRKDPMVPKPRAYPRIEYPEQGMQDFSKAECPFTFQYPVYGGITIKNDQPCWFDISMPAFKAKLHCSYVPVRSKEEFDGLVLDVFRIAEKINARANYMEEMPIRNANGAGGLSFTWTGAAASPLHFFLTHTTQHFFKAALYFEAEVKPDSLAPIVEFVEKDIDKMIASFKWK